MTEAQWLAETQPIHLIYYKACRSERKRRLLVCACLRRVLPLVPGNSFHALIDLAERYADGLATADDLKVARKNGRQARAQAGDVSESADAAAQSVLAALEKAPMSFLMALEAACHAQAARDRRRWNTADRKETLAQCALVHDIFGNPFRPSPPLSPAILSWNDGTVRRIGEGVYKGRLLPEGALDTARLAILADALLDASCNNEELLAHLRSEGPHVRGCWAVDLILGRA